MGELRRRGVETLVFGRRQVETEVRAELGVVPHFRVNTYAKSDGDPFCGWLTGFDTFARRTCEDLARLPTTGPEDVVLATSSRPAQLSALIDWRATLPPERRPTIVVESASTGLTVRRVSNNFQTSVPDPREDSRATLFRFVAKRLPREEGARFHFITFGPLPSRLFRLILKYPVRTLPMPYTSVNPLRNRAGAWPVTVAILGHQKLAKGYDRLPEIVAELLRRRLELRLLVQNVAPEAPPEIGKSLREIAAYDARLTLE